MVSQDTLVRSGLEVYKTTDTNAETVSEETEKEGFTLHNGTIKEVFYTDEMTDNSFEHDYEDISSNGSISLVEVDDTRFYKGTKILLKKAHNPKKWTDLKNCLMGFITEQTYSEEGVDLKIAGMTKLLDQEKQFSFTKTKRSKILKEIVETSGLKCKIDTKGLKDDVINYSNVTSSGGSNSSSYSEEISTLANEIAGNETDEYKKFEKAHQWGCKNIPYKKYECTNHNNDPDECLKNKDKGLSCGDTSILMNAIYSALGLKSHITHGNYHFWNIVTINNKKYCSDCSGNNGHEIGKVWGNNTPLGGSKVKGNNLCS